MITDKKVKSDLESIKFYYANQQSFDIAVNSIGECAVIETVKRYNEAIKDAPAMLFDLYVSLYVMGQTQLEVALDWERCADYVYKQNIKLRKYLSERISA